MWRNKHWKSLIRSKPGSQIEKETKKRKKKPLIISRLPLDKHGGKCHSIQEPPRAAACLDTAFPEFLLITGWEIFGGGVCLCLLEINSCPVGRQWRVNGLALQQATLASAQRLGSWDRHRQDSPVPGTRLLGQGCRPCCVGGYPSPCAASQCQDAATSPGAASDSRKPLRHSGMGTDWDHGGQGCPERLLVPCLLSLSLCRRTRSPYRSLHPQGWHCTLAGPTVLMQDPSDSWRLSLQRWEPFYRGRRQGDMAACCHMPTGHGVPR